MPSSTEESPAEIATTSTSKGEEKQPIPADITELYTATIAEKEAAAGTLPPNFQPTVTIPAEDADAAHASNWVFGTKATLHWEPLSRHAIEVKLANMSAALAAGADPNQMDRTRSLMANLGRPLHCALGDQGPADTRITRQNLAVIRLLLAHGADPRLSGPAVPPELGGLSSPLEAARRRMAGEWDPYPDEGRELLQCGFYAEAYRLMKEAADRLDEEDAAREKAAPGMFDRIRGLFQR